MIVITDGKQTTTNPYTELSVASQGVKNKGVAVYAVGVGKGADVAELREIASSQENVYVSASFKELQPVAVEIRKKLCECKFIFSKMNALLVCLKLTLQRYFIRQPRRSFYIVNQKVEFVGYTELYFLLSSILVTELIFYYFLVVLPPVTTPTPAPTTPGMWYQFQNDVWPFISLAIRASQIKY